ncbi:MAG: hypothetical protein V1916_02140 [Patescibacteria group bacterium]
MQKPNWASRLVWTLVLVGLWIGARMTFQAMRGPIESKAAVHQLEGGTVEYSISRLIAEGAIQNWIGWTFFVAIVLVWVFYLIKLRRFNNAN